jgi:uncharacterized cupredoxin-like copper-binding protein
MALAAATLLLFSACSNASPPDAPGPHFTLRDFHIDSSQQVISAGNVVLHIYNDSPSTHEFVLIKTDLPPSALPLDADGLSIDESQFQHAGEISEVDTQTNRTLTLNLAPGKYVFFCNLEGHFLGGMHGVLDVVGP